MPDTQALLLIATASGVWITLVRDIHERRKANSIDHKLDDLHDAMNGKMDRLLHEYGKAQRAEGVEQERGEERARRALEEKEIGES